MRIIFVATHPSRTRWGRRSGGWRRGWRQSSCHLAQSEIVGAPLENNEDVTTDFVTCEGLLRAERHSSAVSMTVRIVIPTSVVANPSHPIVQAAATAIRTIPHSDILDHLNLRQSDPPPRLMITVGVGTGFVMPVAVRVAVDSTARWTAATS